MGLNDFDQLMKKNRPVPPPEKNPRLGQQIWARIQAEGSQKEGLRWASAFAIPLFTLILGLLTSHYSQVRNPIAVANKDLSAVSKDMVYDFEDEDSLGEIDTFASLGL